MFLLFIIKTAVSLFHHNCNHYTFIDFHQQRHQIPGSDRRHHLHAFKHHNNNIFVDPGMISANLVSILSLTTNTHNDKKF